MSSGVLGWTLSLGPTIQNLRLCLTHYELDAIVIAERESRAGRRYLNMSNLSLHKHSIVQVVTPSKVVIINETPNHEQTPVPFA